jgi:pimeloyl-ACP methyl ester carboxylesterase
MTSASISPEGRRRRSRPAPLVILSLVVFLSGAPARSAGPAPPPPPAPGRLIDLGGYRLHLWCTGDGAPAVVLSAGAGDFSFTWALVQPEISKLTRVCSYDRAGEAWSDLGPVPRTRVQEVFDLRRALEKAGVSGPYVLVGHSLGGDVVRLFAGEDPADVAGMVLVDAGHEEDTFNIRGNFTTLRALSKGRPIPEPRATIAAGDGLDDAAAKQIREMILKYDLAPKIEPPYERLPADAQKLQLWAAGSLEHFAATIDDYAPEEAERLHEIDRKSPHPLGSIPLFVLSQDMTAREDEHAKIHMRTQAEMAGYSERGRQIVVSGAGHHIQLEHPEAVIDAVKSALADARAARGKDLPAK